MVSKTSIAFALVLATVGAGVDYHQQSLKLDMALGDLSPEDYWETIKYRIAGEPAEEPAEEPVEEPVEVRRFGSDGDGFATCSNIGSAKRCQVGGD